MIGNDINIHFLNCSKKYGSNRVPSRIFSSFPYSKINRSSVASVECSEISLSSEKMVLYSNQRSSDNYMCSHHYM